MLLEAQHSAQILHLPLELLHQETTHAVVFDPRIQGFAGRVNASKYSFIFFGSGRLHYILLSPEKSDEQLHLYDAPATISTNDAYRLASNWLAAISVDVSRLESNAPVGVRQKFRYKRDNIPLMETPKPDEPVNLLPVFEVKWGDWWRPKVYVIVDGKGELVALRQEDDSYSKRPILLSSNEIHQLEAIPDADFAKFSESDRRKLVDNSLKRYESENSVSTQ